VTRKFHLPWTRHLSLFPKTDDLEITWRSGPIQVRCKGGFELAAYVFLFAPNTRWAHISDRLATVRHLSLCLIRMTLRFWVQGHPKSFMKMHLNSQYIVFYLLTIQYGHSSLTVWPERATLCRKTDGLEILGSRSSKVKCEGGFELAAYYN